MSDARIRLQIALVAARLMYEREESEYYTAKRKAARQLGLEGRTRPGDMPSNAEIREQIQGLANLHEGKQRTRDLRAMRVEALRLMRLLSAFRPHLIGSVLTGHTRKGSDIDLHVFSDHPSAVTTVLEEEHLEFTVERKKVRKHNEERVFTHVHVAGRFNIELTLYAANQVNYPFKSSITGKVIERASLRELEEMLGEVAEEAEDRFEVFRALLTPLEKVRQNPAFHPEGDALYHSLQAFEIARERAPYDEELILAALLHDVGKGIDSQDHVQAGLESLEGVITERTEFLIRHHMDAHELGEGTLGYRARMRLQASEHYEDLLLLNEIDREARRVGVQVCSVGEALEYVRTLEEDYC